MTWKIKWRTAAGTHETLHDEPAKVREIFDEAKEKGLQPWIEDQNGRSIERHEF